MDKFSVNEKGFGRLMDSFKKVVPDVEIEKIDRISALKKHPRVFPYFVTRVAPTIYHLTVVPKVKDVKKILILVYDQAVLNDLETCLVLSEDQSLYFENKTVRMAKERPSGGILLTGQLSMSADLEKYSMLDPSYLARVKTVEEYIKAQPEGYMFGDLTKGGRQATEEEILELEKPNEKYPGVPNGLVLCEECLEYKGTCLDPSEDFKHQVMQVHCKCDNQNKCARCKELLYDKKLCANFYKKKDGNIWHVPGFNGLVHKCS